MPKKKVTELTEKLIKNETFEKSKELVNNLYQNRFEKIFKMSVPKLIKKPYTAPMLTRVINTSKDKDLMTSYIKNLIKKPFEE